MSWYLGLDISTSCTGLCLLASDGSGVVLNHIVLSNIQDAFCKARKVREVLLEVKETHQVSRIFIEENLQSFRTGLSSAHTINTLARFNGVVSYLSQEIFDIQPEFINATKARSSLLIPVDRKSAIPVKRQVFRWVRGQLPGYAWPIKKNRDGTGDDDFRDIAMDMSDAYVIARAGALKTL